MEAPVAISEVHELAAVLVPAAEQREGSKAAEERDVGGRGVGEQVQQAKRPIPITSG